MNGEPLFDEQFNPTQGMVRASDLPDAERAAVQSLPTVQANRLLILRLLVEHEWLTMFCPYVLMGGDTRYKQTAIGPRFRKLRDQGLIRLEPSRRPRDGAESVNLVSSFTITPAGRAYLEAQR